ncbi:MAG: phosphoribosyltransferase, partial [bacterium]
SYGKDMISSGEVKLELDTTPDDLCDWWVLLTDDIADTGLTLHFLHQHLFAKGAFRVMTCVLLDKPSRRSIQFKPDFVGFTIPDRFVVGYGLDYSEDFRYLPYIGYISSPEFSYQIK